MPAPHDQSLRDRVVSAYERGVGSFATVGIIFGVGEASVNRWVNEARRKGQAVAKPMGGARRAPIIDESGEIFIRQRLGERANITQAELASEFTEHFGVGISRRAMGDALARMGITKKNRDEGRLRPSAPMSSRGEAGG